MLSKDFKIFIIALVFAHTWRRFIQILPREIYMEKTGILHMNAY